MPATKHICPVEGCLDTFSRTKDVKAHMNLHLVCQCVRQTSAPRDAAFLPLESQLVPVPLLPKGIPA